jgi:hypothetical protein
VKKSISGVSKHFSPTLPSHRQTLLARDAVLIMRVLKESLARESREATDKMVQIDSW